MSFESSLSFVSSICVKELSSGFSISIASSILTLDSGVVKSLPLSSPKVFSKTFSSGSVRPSVMDATVGISSWICSRISGFPFSSCASTSSFVSSWTWERFSSKISSVSVLSLEESSKYSVSSVSEIPWETSSSSSKVKVPESS